MIKTFATPPSLNKGRRPMTKRRLAWVFALLLLLANACGGSGEDQPPSIKLLSPFDPISIPFGEILQVESRSRDDHAVHQVELRVNGIAVDLLDAPAGEKSYRLMLRWQPPEPGNYAISVVAYDDQGQVSPPAAITVEVGPAQAPTPPSPEPATRSPTVVPIPTITATPTPPNPACSIDASFVTDVTIPDNTRLAPGTEFVKTWRLRNSGDCDWGAGFQFALVEGDQMGAPASVPVPPTARGATVDLSVRFRTPEGSGTYRSTWRLRTPDGEPFGDQPYVQIVVE
jgi:hypothetical protein